MRRSLLLLFVSTLATVLLAAGATTPAFAADSDGPVDYGDDGPVDFGENDAESRLFAQNVACQPPNRSKRPIRRIDTCGWTDRISLGLAVFGMDVGGISSSKRRMLARETTRSLKSVSFVAGRVVTTRLFLCCRISENDCSRQLGE